MTATNGIDNTTQLDTISIGLPQTNIPNGSTPLTLTQLTRLEKRVKCIQYRELLHQSMILLLLIYVHYLVEPTIERNTSKLDHLCSILSTTVSSNVTDYNLLCR